MATVSNVSVRVEKQLDDDFKPMVRKPKLNPNYIQAMILKSNLNNCTFNIHIP